MSQAEEREWIEKEKAAAAAAAGGSSSSPEGYHFICEVFFMTLQVWVYVCWCIVMCWITGRHMHCVMGARTCVLHRARVWV